MIPTGDKGKNLEADTIRDLFRELDERLQEKGVTAEITVTGGARVTLAHPGEKTTDGIDILYTKGNHPGDETRNQIAAEMRRESNGSLNPDWLSDDRAHFTIPAAAADDERKETIYQGTALTVHATCAERTLMLKLDKLEDYSGRLADNLNLESETAQAFVRGRVETDVSDIAKMADEVGIESVEQMQELYRTELAMLGSKNEMGPHAKAELAAILPEHAPTRPEDRDERTDRVAAEPASELAEMDLGAQTLADRLARIAVPPEEYQHLETQGEKRNSRLAWMDEYLADEAAGIDRDTADDIDEDELNMANELDGDIGRNPDLDDMINKARRDAEGDFQKEQATSRQLAGPPSPVERPLAVQRPSAKTHGQTPDLPSRPARDSGAAKRDDQTVNR